MAGLAQNSTGSSPHPIAAPVSSGQHFQTIAWLRWRLFVNALRGKGAVGELVVRILSYPLLAVIVIGPSIGAGIFSYLLVSQNEDAYLAIVLWVIFFLWQFIGISTSATGPNFDIASLTRFPIRYRDYLLIRISFGLMDPPTLAGIGCLIAMTIGISIAAPAMAPWAALLMFLFAACNVFFSRMIYSWLERWLAQRRTRELFTALLLIFSLGIQFVGQLAGRLGHRGHHSPVSPWMDKLTHALVTINWYLPPGLATASFQNMHRGLTPLAMASLSGLLIYTLAFLFVFQMRLKAEYHGENLSEAPAALSAKTLAKDRKQRAAEIAAARTADARPRRQFLSSTVSACLTKEVRYLMRSGPKLYALIMPVFMIVLISVRTAGLRQAGVGSSDLHTFMFSSGCAYTQMILVGLIYNSLGADGPGVQFYFMAPLRFRDVILAKNLLTGIILAIEVTLIYLASAFLGAKAPLALVVATIAWSLFAFLLNISIGNVRSLISPKGYEAGKVRRQNVSGLNSLISLGVILVASSLGAAIIVACRFFDISYWMAAIAFFILAAVVAGVYLISLQNIDRVAAEHMESLTLELCKS